MTFQSIRIGRGEHATIVGVTGTGKTQLARRLLLPAFPRVLVIDSEVDSDGKSYDFDDFPHVNREMALKLAKSDYAFVAAYDPPDVSYVESLCAGLLLVGHDMAVYFDEVTDFSTPSVIPPQMFRLIRKMRKRGVSVIVGTQRPQNLNKNFLSNAIHRFWLYVPENDMPHLKEYAKTVAPYMDSIPYGSYHSLYQGIDGQVSVLSPAPLYDWAKRLKAQKSKTRSYLPDISYLRGNQQ